MTGCTSSTAEYVVVLLLRGTWYELLLLSCLLLKLTGLTLPAGLTGVSIGVLYAITVHPRP